MIKGAGDLGGLLIVENEVNCFSLELRLLVFYKGSVLPARPKAAFDPDPIWREWRGEL